MARKFLLLFFLILLFGGFLGTKFLILDKQNDLGQLTVKSTPVAEVFVNNIPLGSTPLDKYKYKVGEYLIKLIPEKTATETASWQGKVNIYKNSLTYVNRELGISDISSAGEIFTITKMSDKPKNGDVGEIAVDTDPTGAIVYLDNDEKGIAPLVLAEVLKGDHEISVFMPGFFRRTQKVNVTAGYRVNAQFKLALDESATPKASTPSASISPSPSSKPEQKESTTSATIKNGQIKILDTPTGFLRVRVDPSIDASESAQVHPGETYPLIDEQNGWYKIKLPSLSGWVYSQYASKE